VNEPRSRRTIGSLMALVAASALVIVYRRPLAFLIEFLVGAIALVTLVALLFVGIAAIPLSIWLLLLRLYQAEPTPEPGRAEHPGRRWL